MKAKRKQEEERQAAPAAGQPYDLAEAPSQPNLQDRIRQRAYELSQQRDGQAGDALDDWYRAEAEIQAAFGTAEFNGATLTEAEEQGQRGFGARIS